jgi:hypothetical protein
MTASRAEKQLEGELWRCVEECKSLGYNPAYFVRMLDDRGGLATMKKLINDNTPSDGFTKLWELQRLDLTVEAVALRSPYAALVTQGDRIKARRRLEDYGYKP